MVHTHHCAAGTHRSTFLAQVERLQQRSLEKCARLQADIQATKTQKVLYCPSYRFRAILPEVGVETDPRMS